MKNSMTLKMTVLTAVIGFAMGALAEESTMEKAEAGGNKAVDSTKETVRDIKDKTCETFDSKGKCIVKKVKHKVETAVDKTTTKAKEVKNKAD